MFDGPGHGPFGFFWGAGAFLSGVLITAAVVAVAILLVRYLIVATRAAQLYLDSHESTRPAAPPPTVTRAAAPAPATTNTSRSPRTPKTPPAV